jgi:hypothetical protein
MPIKPFAIMGALACLLAFPLGAAGPSGTPDFSGSYTLTKTERYTAAQGHVYTMTVAETTSSIQVTRGGADSQNRVQQMSTVYPLKGQSKCATMIAAYFPLTILDARHSTMYFPGASTVQPTGTCSAKWKKGQLTLQSYALVPMNGSDVPVIYTEHWRLADSRTLRIEYDLVFTNMANPVRNFVAYYVRK